MSTEPAAHGIVERASRGHEILPADTKTQKIERDAVEMFLIRATSDMLTRMRDGLRRGWGDGWKRGYSDVQVLDRLDAANDDLTFALQHYRNGGAVGIDELRKRAADVSNQAFMLADPERLRNTE